MSNRVFLLVVLLYLLIAPVLVNAEVKIAEESLVIPTCKIGEPEVNPIFYAPTGYQNAQLHIYPYTRIDKLRDEKIDKAYTTLVLENEYIKSVVLPEIGGHLYIAEEGWIKLCLMCKERLQ